MNLYDKVNDEFKKAYISKDNVRLAAMRDLKARIQNAEKGVGSEKAIEITDESVLMLIRRAIKQNKESMDDASRHGNDEMFWNFKNQNDELELFLIENAPGLMTEAEVTKAVQEIAGTVEKQFGAVMREFQLRHKGRADNSVVKRIITQVLG